MERKEITDLGFIAGLVTLGYEPVEMFKQGSIATFVFEWDDHMEQMKQDYFENKLTGKDFRTYNGVLRSIKKQIYSMVEERQR